MQVSKARGSSAAPKYDSMFIMTTVMAPSGGGCGWGCGGGGCEGGGGGCGGGGGS